MTEADYADLDLVGFLYNTCYGGFGFSEAFLERLNGRRAQAGLEPVDEHYGIFACHKEERTDPMAVELFEEMGSKASSGFCSQIQIRKFPREFIRYIDTTEYDGKESVRLDTNTIYTRLLKEFIGEFRANPTIQAAELERRYSKMQAILSRYNEYKKNVVFKAKNVVSDSE